MPHWLNLEPRPGMLPSGDRWTSASERTLPAKRKHLWLARIRDLFLGSQPWSGFGVGERARRPNQARFFGRQANSGPVRSYDHLGKAQQTGSMSASAWRRQLRKAPWRS